MPTNNGSPSEPSKPLTSQEYDTRFGPMPEDLTSKAVMQRQGTVPLDPNDPEDQAILQIIDQLPTDGEG